MLCATKTYCNTRFAGERHEIYCVRVLPNLPPVRFGINATVQNGRETSPEGATKRSSLIIKAYCFLGLLEWGLDQYEYLINCTFRHGFCNNL